MPRPFKIWNRDRTVKKAVVVESMKELTEKGKVKLSLQVDEEVQVVLEEDGTYVEDEDYFQCLPDNTIFILLPCQEQWLSRKKTRADGFDVPDTIGSAGDQSREQELCLLLHEDFHVIATFSETDMEVLINMKASDMSQMLPGKTEKFCEQLQTTCQQYLDDRLQARETAELVKLYQEVTASGGDGRKRKKAEKNVQPELPYVWEKVLVQTKIFIYHINQHMQHDNPVLQAKQKLKEAVFNEPLSPTVNVASSSGVSPRRPLGQEKGIRESVKSSFTGTLVSSADQLDADPKNTDSLPSLARSTLEQKQDERMAMDLELTKERQKKEDGDLSARENQLKERELLLQMREKQLKLQTESAFAFRSPELVYPRGKVCKDILSGHFMNSLIQASSSVAKVTWSNGTCGTGFRVGSRYLITIYDLVREDPTINPDEEERRQNVRSCLFNFDRPYQHGDEAGLRSIHLAPNAVVIHDEELHYAVLQLIDDPGNPLPEALTKFTKLGRHEKIHFAGHPEGQAKVMDIQCSVVVHHPCADPNQALYHTSEKMAQGTCGSPGLVSDGEENACVAVVHCGRYDLVAGGGTEYGIRMEAIYRHMHDTNEFLCKDIFPEGEPS